MYAILNILLRVRNLHAHILVHSQTPVYTCTCMWVTLCYLIISVLWIHEEMESRCIVHCAAPGNTSCLHACMHAHVQYNVMYTVHVHVYIHVHVHACSCLGGSVCGEVEACQPTFSALFCYMCGVTQADNFIFKERSVGGR